LAQGNLPLFSFANMLALLWTAALSADPSFDQAFNEFEIKFGREYNTTNGEREYRRLIFISNMKYISEFNNGQEHSFTLGVGPFADKTFEEFDLYASRGRLPDEHQSEWGNSPNLGIVDTPLAWTPKAIDWVSKGAVTSVKNQGSCGSCWTFASTGCLEGHYQIMTGRLKELSQQQLLDCDTASSRCDGGFEFKAFDFVKKFGICSSQSYPYECKNGASRSCSQSTCTFRCRKGIAPNVVSGYIMVRPRNPRALLAALTHGPVNVGVAANSRQFSHYSKGVLVSSACGYRIGHAVLAVGYGDEAGLPYWLIKNSWGSGWGLDGYIKIGRNLHPRAGGECGILTRPSYPVLDREAVEAYVSAEFSEFMI